MGDCVGMTDWEKVDEHEYYLSDDWLVKKMGSHTKKDARELRKRAKNGELYHGYLAPAMSVAVYKQFDAESIIITDNLDIVVHGESIVASPCEKHWEEEC